MPPGVAMLHRQFPFHDAKTLAADLIVAHRVIDEQAGQIEQAGEPGHHENQVQGLEPEHNSSIKQDVNQI